MVFYFSPCEFPCNVSDWQNHCAEIYELLASAGNARNDGNEYTINYATIEGVDINTLTVTTKLPETDANFNSTTYAIDRVEFFSKPTIAPIKVTLSA